MDVWQSRLLNNKAWYMSNGGDGTGGAVHAEGWAEVSHQTLELDRYGSLAMANSYLRGNYAPPKVAKTVVRTPVDSPANSCLAVSSHLLGRASHGLRHPRSE